MSISSHSRFDFYEKVIVTSRDPAKAEVNGELGAVLGKACGDDGRWSYAVSIYRSGVCWSCWEDELKATGEFDRQETFFDGTSIRVSGDGKVVGND